jgi:hypothetical protein
MIFDPSVETPIRLQDVPKLNWLPGRRSGSRLNVSTVFRWVQRGCRGVQLETIRIGGALCTSEEALKRFFARLSDPATPISSPTPAQRQKQIARADRDLEAAGY